MSMSLRAPLAGRVVALDDVPDPVFSRRLIGAGAAVDPDRSGKGAVTARAPVTGTISKIHPHAYVIAAPEGRGVLVHLGLDTVELEGAGFTVHVTEGQAVSVGDPVVTWTPAAVEAGGHSPLVPIIALDAEAGALQLVPAGEHVTAGDVVCTWN